MILKNFFIFFLCNLCNSTEKTKYPLFPFLKTSDEKDQQYIDIYNQNIDNIQNYNYPPPSASVLRYNEEENKKKFYEDKNTLEINDNSKNKYLLKYKGLFCFFYFVNFFQKLLDFLLFILILINLFISEKYSIGGFFFSIFTIILNLIGGFFNKINLFFNLYNILYLFLSIYFIFAGIFIIFFKYISNIKNIFITGSQIVTSLDLPIGILFILLGIFSIFFQSINSAYYYHNIIKKKKIETFFLSYKE